MKLMHYTAEPLVFDRARTYKQLEPCQYQKPEGFWVSVEGECDWPSWCRENDYGIHRLVAAQRVTLADGARIHRITTIFEIDEFTADFAVQTYAERRFDWMRDDKSQWPIDWRAVAAEWDGIIIAPYQWSRRRSHTWYYNWDCASGCIWNLDAIAAVDPAEAVKS